MKKPSAAQPSGEKFKDLRMTDIAMYMGEIIIKSGGDTLRRPTLQLSQQLTYAYDKKRGALTIREKSNLAIDRDPNVMPNATLLLPDGYRMTTHNIETAEGSITLSNTVAKRIRLISGAGNIALTGVTLTAMQGPVAQIVSIRGETTIDGLSTKGIVDADTSIGVIHIANSEASKWVLPEPGRFYLDNVSGDEFEPLVTTAHLTTNVTDPEWDKIWDAL